MIAGGIYQRHREIETQSVEMSPPWEEDEEMSRCEETNKGHQAKSHVEKCRSGN